MTDRQRARADFEEENYRRLRAEWEASCAAKKKAGVQ
jgi:hypothetical protein